MNGVAKENKSQERLDVELNQRRPPHSMHGSTPKRELGVLLLPHSPRQPLPMYPPINPNPLTSHVYPFLISPQEKRTPRNKTKDPLPPPSSSSSSPPAAMKIMKIIFMITTTMVVTVFLGTINITEEEKAPPPVLHHDRTAASSVVLPFPSQRRSRFLAEQKNPRAADHCNKNNQVCSTTQGANSTCCNNKCVYLQEDWANCGACKTKCDYTQECCRGKCVYTFMDKRHCGKCNNRCKVGDECIFGMCSYGG